jgi:hypothetical protein
MKLLKYLSPFLTLIAGLMLNTGPSFATKEYTAKEKKPCMACHIKNNDKELNDVGKCYEKSKSLAGCEPAKKK